jgi:hypothetical protein
MKWSDVLLLQRLFSLPSKPSGPMAQPTLQSCEFSSDIWHGGWVTLPHRRIWIRAALLVCHLRLRKSGRAHNLLRRTRAQLIEQRTVPGTLEGMSGLFEKMDRHRCHLVFQRSHPLDSRGGCFGVCGTPPVTDPGSQTDTWNTYQRDHSSRWRTGNFWGSKAAVNTDIECHQRPRLTRASHRAMG